VNHSSRTPMPAGRLARFTVRSSRKPVVCSWRSTTSTRLDRCRGGNLTQHVGSGHRVTKQADGFRRLNPSCGPRPILGDMSCAIRQIQRREGKGPCLTDAAHLNLTRRPVRVFGRYAMIRTRSISVRGFLCGGGVIKTSFARDLSPAATECNAPPLAPHCQAELSRHGATSPCRAVPICRGNRTLHCPDHAWLVRGLIHPSFGMH
jgi:hypothetical protein